MNKKYRGAVFAGTGLLVIVGITTLLLFGGSADQAACQTVGSVVTHRVEIKNDKLSPVHTDARRCERLLIVNSDKTTRLMAFGQHDKHVTYDGVEERMLNPGQSLQVTLIQTGTFIFHDHMHDEIKGSFTVRP